MRKGLVIAVMGIVLTAITSCRTISSLLHDDGVVAQVNDVKLYRAELNALIPKGMSPADSAELAQKYINSWASDLVYLKVAEQQLSKSEKDVTKELEDYRKSLLKYRYEQLYVNERLDTTVTEDAVQEYYDAHPEKFILKRPLLRARYLNIQKDSPALKQLKDLGIPFEARVMSAHRTPTAAADFAKSAIDNGFGAIICAAGKAAHLAGAFAFGGATVQRDLLLGEGVTFVDENTVDIHKHLWEE